MRNTSRSPSPLTKICSNKNFNVSLRPDRIRLIMAVFQQPDVLYRLSDQLCVASEVVTPFRSYLHRCGIFRANFHPAESR